MLSAVERSAISRAEEQVAGLRSLRSQGEKLRCLECCTEISKRRKFGLCKKCFPKYDARREDAAAA